jgi:predicted Fe-Mo cluster-binding NifX family protein
MKIGISSAGKDENSKISETAGRAPFYFIFEDKKLVKVIKNPFAIGSGGAGFSVAKMLENEKVDLVVSGSFGLNMQNALITAGIKYKVEKNKKVKDVINTI